MFLKLGRVMHSCDGAGGSIVYGRPELHSETPLKKKKSIGQGMVVHDFVAEVGRYL